MQPVSFHACWKRLTLGLLLASSVVGMQASAAERSGGVVAWHNGQDANFAWVHPDALSGVVAVSMTKFMAIAIKEDGRIVAWGSFRSDESALFADLPPMASVLVGGRLMLSRDGRVFQRSWDGTNVALPFPSEGFMAIASGGSHHLALRKSGEVVCWGRNDLGQATVPEGLKDVQAIAAGDGHSVALRRDGTVVAWGGNYGWPDNFGRAVAVAAGYHCILVIRDGGTVAAWGDGISQPPEGLSGVTAIATSAGNVLAVRQGGTLASWSEARSSSLPVPAELSGVFAVALGQNHAFALGELTVPTIEEHPTAVSVPPWQSVEFRVRAQGFGRQFQWLRDGQPIRGATNATLTIAGPFVCNAAGEYTVRVSNTVGSVTSEPALLTLVPAEVPRTTIRWGDVADQGLAEAFSDPSQDFVAIAVGGGMNEPRFFLGLTGEGTVVGWGSNRQGQTSIPVGLSDVRAIAAGTSHGVAVSGSGRITIWGDPYSAGLIPESEASGIIAVAAGSWFTLALTSDGSLLEFGLYRLGISQAIRSGRTRLIAANGVVGAALTDDGRLFVRKLYHYIPELPVVTNAPSRLPHAVQIAVNHQVGCALNGDGTLQVWAPPELVGNEVLASVTNGAAIAAGDSVILVLRKDGSVLHVSSGGTSHLEPPYELRDVVAISASGRTAAAVGRSTTPRIESGHETRLVPQWQTEKLSVEASGFGLNFLWYHGDRVLIGETNATLVLPAVREETSAGNYFVRVSNPAGATMHHVATVHVSPQTEPGTVVAWGAGITSLRQRSGERAWVPERLAGVRFISAGFDHDVAVLDDGTVRSWAQWGFEVPLPPPDLSDIVAVAASWLHVVALVRDGTVRCWAREHSGQCGVPAGLTDVISVAAGGFVSMVLRRDGTLVAWGDRWRQPHRVAEELGPLRAIALSPEGVPAFLLQDGTVVVWYGGSEFPQVVQTGIHDATAIAMGTEHLLALTREGLVRARTFSNHPDLGYDTGAARVPAGLTNVVAIAAGTWCSLALKADGTVEAWGEFTTRGSFVSESPEPPNGLTGVTAIAAGEAHALALLGPAPLPILRLVTHSGGITIRWQSTDATHRLESADALSPPNWQSMSGSPVTDNGWSVVPIVPGDEARFYRLTRP